MNSESNTDSFITYITVNFKIIMATKEPICLSKKRKRANNQTYNYSERYLG